MPGKWSFIAGIGLGVGIAGVAFAGFMQFGNYSLPNVSSPSHHGLVGDPFDGGYLQAKQAYEDHWQRKIHAAIAYIPEAIVAVEVHVADLRSDVEYSLDYDEQPITTELVVRTTSGRTRDADELSPGDSPEASELEEHVEETTRSLVSKHERRVTHSPFSPESVRVAVSAPRSYLRRIAGSPTGTSGIDPRAFEAAEELVTHQLTNTVVTLIPPPPPGDDPYPLVVVEWFDDSP